MKTISEVRNQFWEDHPEFKRQVKRVKSKNGRYYYTPKDQNDYNPTIRTAFVNWVDYMEKDGQISEEIADKTTLK